MAHLPRLAEVDPGLPPGIEGPSFAPVETRHTLEAIQMGQLVGIHPVQLAVNAAFARDPHGERAQITEINPRDLRFRHESRATELVMIAKAAPEGAVDEQQITRGVHGPQNEGSHDRRESHSLKRVQ